MNTKIFCYFLKKYTEKLDQPPYPGEIGKKIYKTISKKAWNQWMSKQTKIINEKKLNMLDINDRKILENHMVNFLFKNINNV
ncbi:MAG: oxidative damage protection protein [Buchnera aphidicola (Schlechtendalia peitan)]